MFKGWAIAEVIAFWMLVATVLGGIAAGVLHSVRTGRRFGKFEAQHDQMQSDITNLKIKAEKHDQLDTAIQLLSQSMGTIQSAVSEMRLEGREARQEMREAVAELKSETREALSEVRQDLRGLTRTS